MAPRAKRKHGQATISTASRTKSSPSESSASPVKRDLLERSYPLVQTLRQYLLSKLPASSRLRRKKISALGKAEVCGESEIQVAQVLDTTLVCGKGQPLDHAASDMRWQQWVSFSQKGDESYVTISDAREAESSQSEIVDFVIWMLFSRDKKTGSWPKHMLCDGFRRTATEVDHGGSTIPGIFSRFPNYNVATLRVAPWPQILALLGQAGEKVMLDLLLDCSIFVAVEAGFGNYYQLSGNPISELEQGNGLENQAKTTCRRATEITLIRSRIFYAKPALTARGQVHAGFKHIHVLNRCALVRDTEPSEPAKQVARPSQQLTVAQRNEASIARIMMYIFPRQFRLHNVFTSEVDRTKTSQKFQDYTLREEEIAPIIKPGKDSSTPKIPKRLRGIARDLVERLQVRHSRCSYSELLHHYCPSPLQTAPRKARGNLAPSRESVYHTRGSNPSTLGSSLSQSRQRASVRARKQFRKPPQMTTTLRYDTITDLACPMSHVSAFCQSVLSNILPNGFWGEGDTMEHNKAIVMKKVDRFIKMRRFETMSLHEVAQDLKVKDIPWLQQPHLQGQAASQTDTAKRTELFLEFLYYVFDSLLIPLIRSNFYITESSVHRHQVLYFRHDVWKSVAEPAMAKLKEQIFEEVKMTDAKRILDARTLGFSQIRLLPKGKDMRPITNLRKRALGTTRSKILGPSINSVLTPLHTMLKLEKDLHPDKLGATLFSVNDIYGRLKGFKESLPPGKQRLYFAKVDVRAAFDSLPQDAVLRLMASIPSQGQYTITKHVEVRPGDPVFSGKEKKVSKPIRRWLSTALSNTDRPDFPVRVENQLGPKAKNTVFVDRAVRQTHATRHLIGLLDEHVSQNLVKVGKKFYRQKTGIPQGSVLSAILCNYFYADLEMKQLGFLDGRENLLMRLIDDFLLVTPDKTKAERFVQVMHEGLPEYGVEVNPKKTLVNFDMVIGQDSVGKLVDTPWFPYCGTVINCKTLEITKDQEKRQAMDITHSLTVELGRVPGQNFERKVLNALKIQLHVMYFDTEHNSSRTVLATLHGVFAETARKMWAYIRHMPKPQQPRASLVIHTINKVIGVAFSLLTGKSRRARYEKYSCDVRRAQVTLTACEAFTGVLKEKQSGYGDVLKWLERESSRIAARKK